MPRLKRKLTHEPAQNYFPGLRQCDELAIKHIDDDSLDADIAHFYRPRVAPSEIKKEASSGRGQSTILHSYGLMK